MNQPGYQDHLEHLEDEIRLLDLHLVDAVERFERPDRPAELEQFKGLVLSATEVSDLLQRGDREAGTEPSDEGRRRLRAQIDQRVDATCRAGAYLPLIHLHQIVRANEFEKFCLILAAAPEVDRKYEKVYGYLQDDVTCKHPTVDLALSLFCSRRRERLANSASFAPTAPLRRLRVLELREEPPDSRPPLVSRRLKLDDRIVRFLTGFSGVDESLAEIVELLDAANDNAEAAAPLPESTREVHQRLVRLLDGHFGAPDSTGLVLHLCGRYGSGRRELAEAACRHLNLPLLLVDLRKLTTFTDYEESVWKFCREAILQPAALCFEHTDELLTQDPSRLHRLVHGTDTFSRLTFLLGTRSWRPIGLFREQHFISLECPTPNSATRHRLWQQELGDCSPNLETNGVGELAAKFEFTPGQIRDAASAARMMQLLEAPEEEVLDPEILHRACREQANPKLATLARKIDPVFCWADIVLPENRLDQLKEIASHVRHAPQVMDSWGFASKFPLGRGVTGLFAGNSGTGKTMAAEILAHELGLDLYKIDLSGVVSKYIGETEKNLSRIFREAQDSNAILFFDEADALFGKRSEVKDSHDRYANIEIAYLLQRMEEYNGIVILATNMKRNMDQAFVRRLRFIVDFPFPGVTDRERIWSKVFPDMDLLAEDVDLGYLALKLKLSGGSIKNIALRAAFLAVAWGADRIDMHCLIEASKRELEKVGKLYTDSDFKRYGRSGRDPQLIREASG